MLQSERENQQKLIVVLAVASLSDGLSFQSFDRLSTDIPIAGKQWSMPACWIP